MQDREYHDALGFDTVENGVWKPGEDCTTHLPVDTRENLRVVLYGIEYSVYGCKKFFAKTVTLPVVPTEIVS